MEEQDKKMVEDQQVNQNDVQEQPESQEKPVVEVAESLSEDTANVVQESQQEVQGETNVREETAESAADATTSTEQDEPKAEDHQVKQEPVQEEPKPEEKAVPQPVESAVDDTADSSEEEEEHDETEHESLLDKLHFDEPTKKELLSVLKEFAHVEEMRIVDQALREIKPHYDKLYQSEEEEAKKAFLEAGNEEADFDYKGSDQDRQFFELFHNLREKKQRFFNQLEKSKDANYHRKLEILDQLRDIVDGVESTTSINALKEIQKEWKSLGPVPGQHAKTLWANYNALMDRFYDNRSIYFELKELDRKKNLEAKIELCERAEKLDDTDNIKEAIIQLNELHEEYKHLGPVPKEDQEPLWQRFKAASDKIYAKRRDYFDSLKKSFEENYQQKEALAQQVEAFAEFQSDRINEWNKKTREILDLQKLWDAVGSVPRDKAKQLNKVFWASFKSFFSHKNAFFKTLEGQRKENLEKKKELIVKAHELKENDDFDKTANEFKRLQNTWREIGPVPEKVRNELYAEFKGACDYFFERKRGQSKELNKEFDINLQKKEEICTKLAAFLEADAINLGEVYDLLDAYAQIGFVPRNAIKAIGEKYDQVTSALLAMEDLSEEQRAELDLQIQMSKLKNSPHGDQKIHRKEGAIRKRIGVLEAEIGNLKTNMGFFAESKNADKLKDNFKEQIQSAELEMEELRKQLNLLKQL